MPTLLLFDIDGTLIRPAVPAIAPSSTPSRSRSASNARWKASLSPAAPTASSCVTPSRAIDGRELTTRCAIGYARPTWGRCGPRSNACAAAPACCPGCGDCSRAWPGDPAYHVALLTGNFSQTAEIKLGYFDLWRHFAWGAFGEDAVERNDLLPVAIARYRARTGLDIASSDVVIIGDTPNDVEVARVGRARSVCVTTGQFDREALLAAGADVVFHDLERRRRGDARCWRGRGRSSERVERTWKPTGPGGPPGLQNRWCPAMRDGWVRLPGASAIAGGRTRARTKGPASRGAGPFRCPVRRDGAAALCVEQSHVARARTLAGVLGVEFDALTFAKQLEHGATNGAAMEEVFNARLIANEAKTLVDEKASNSSRRHTVTSDVPPVASCDGRPRVAVGSTCEDGWPEDWRVPYALQSILPACPSSMQATVALPSRAPWRPARTGQSPLSCLDDIVWTLMGQAQFRSMPGIVLAGGRSLRMGWPKALLPWPGRDT